jgi:hypothetical protein
MIEWEQGTRADLSFPTGALIPISARKYSTQQPNEVDS